MQQQHCVRHSKQTRAARVLNRCHAHHLAGPLSFTPTECGNRFVTGSWRHPVPLHTHETQLSKCKCQSLSHSSRSGLLSTCPCEIPVYASSTACLNDITTSPSSSSSLGAHIALSQRSNNRHHADSGWKHIGCATHLCTRDTNHALGQRWPEPCNPLLDDVCRLCHG